MTAVTAPAANNAWEADVDSPAYIAPAYREMEEGWKICRDTYVGTKAYRADLDTYFPKGDVETPTEQEVRAKRVAVFPLFKDTIKGLTGLALRKPPKLGEDVPSKIVDIAENIDGAGTSFEIFTKRVFADGLKKGHCGILVDAPAMGPIIKQLGRAPNSSEEAAIGARPFWVHVKAEQIINWRTRVINGLVTLTLLVIQETLDRPAGDFGMETVQRFRVFRRDDTGKVSYAIYIQVEDDEPALQEGDGAEGTIANVTKIPFIPFYAGERIGPLQTEPPLIDLAYTNIEHTQVRSDRLTSLHAAGCPILVTKGRVGNAAPVNSDPNAPREYVQTSDGTMTQAGQAPAIVVSANVGIDIDKDGDVFYAEHQGAALGALRDEVQDIENRAAAQGLSMLQRDTKMAQTAEAERIQGWQKTASLSTSSASFKDVLESALAVTAILWKLPKGGSIIMDTEFIDAFIDTAEMTAWSQMEQAGQISRQTLWEKLKQAGKLDDSFDATREEERLTQAAKVNIANAADGTGNNTGTGNPTDANSTANQDIGSGQ